MTAPRPTDDIRRDIARLPAPGGALPDMSWHGLFGVACRLRDDAEALLDRLAAVERERDEARERGESVLEDLHQRDDQLRDLVGRFLAADARAMAAEARLARVEAAMRQIADIADPYSHLTQPSKLPRILDVARAALAAPSPQAEPACGNAEPHRPHDGMAPDSYGPDYQPWCRGVPGPQSTEQLARAVGRYGSNWVRHADDRGGDL